MRYPTRKRINTITEHTPPTPDVRDPALPPRKDLSSPGDGRGAYIFTQGERVHHKTADTVGVVHLNGADATLIIKWDDGAATRERHIDLEPEPTLDITFVADQLDQNEVDRLARIIGDLLEATITYEQAAHCARLALSYRDLEGK